MIAELALALWLGQDSQSTATVRELERFEQQLGATWTAGDCAAWASMLTDDWSVVHVTGATMTKSEAVALCKAPPVPITGQKIDDVKVRVFGDSAVVTGRNTVTVGGATPVTVVLRFTDVFIRRDGRWIVAASHATQLGS